MQVPSSLNERSYTRHSSLFVVLWAVSQLYGNSPFPCKKCETLCRSAPLGSTATTGVQHRPTAYRTGYTGCRLMSPEQLAASLEGGGPNRPSSSRSTPHSPAVGSSSTGRKRSHADAHRADSKGAHDHSKERRPSENANTDDAGDSDDDDPNGTDAKSRKKRSRCVLSEEDASAYACN